VQIKYLHSEGKGKNSLSYVCFYIDAVLYEQSHIDKPKDRFLNQKIEEFLNKTIV